MGKPELFYVEDPRMRWTHVCAALLTAGLASLLAISVTLAAQKEQPKKETPIVPPREGKSQTIKLFDGKDLTGWHGHKDQWFVEEGTIVGRNTKPVKVSTYLLTDEKFSDFRLTAKVKLGEKSETHSGI